MSLGSLLQLIDLDDEHLKKSKMFDCSSSGIFGRLRFVTKCPQGPTKALNSDHANKLNLLAHR